MYFNEEKEVEDGEKWKIKMEDEKRREKEKRRESLSIILCN